MTPVIPDSYRLLAHFSGEPLHPIDTLKRAGFIDEHDRPTPYGRGVLRGLRDQKLLQWVRWADDPQGPVREGLVLTGNGEIVLARYFDRYGPALPTPRDGL